MSLVSSIGSTFAALSLLALSACDGEVLPVPFAVGQFDYQSSTAISGDLDKLEDFDGEGRAWVSGDGSLFTTQSEVPIRQGTAVTVLIYNGLVPFTSLPTGTVLHYAATGDSTLLDAVNPDPFLLIDDADVDVVLCVGDVNAVESERTEEIDEDSYWFDTLADEVVVEIEGTNDPAINEVTITASSENQETGELDIVVTTFDMHL